MADTMQALVGHHQVHGIWYELYAVADCASGKLTHHEVWEGGEFVFSVNYTGMISDQLVEALVTVWNRGVGQGFDSGKEALRREIRGSLGLNERSLA